ncbi:MAG: FAD-binding oxidoreductase [Azospirillaceae bacterium]
MPDTILHTRDGGDAVIDPAEVEALAAGLRGSVSLPADPGFDAARTLWNAMIDRKPGLVVHCRGAADVAAAVRFAAARRLLVSVRSGGHNIAGSAVCDGGLMIDLSPMTAVRVDPESGRVRVQPGATLGDLDRETKAYGLAVPVGINSTTGIAGLTLGGGFGWLSRKHGMTVDSLVSADVVMADGKTVIADATRNTDLFWALRGGGGNFGVVTAFEFQARPVGPEVLSGLLVHPYEAAPELLRRYRDLVADAPDDLTCWVVLRHAPPLPALPEEWHGRPVMVLALCWAGDMAQGEKAVAPLRALGTPIADLVAPHPFVGWQSAFDPLLEPGARNYWKSHDLTALSDAAIDTLLAHVDHLPGQECEVFLAHLGGAMSRVAADETAYPHRDSHFVMNVHTRWREASADAACVGWARGLFDAMTPHATGGVYVNFMPEDEADRTAGAYGPNLARLRAIKRAVDPGNLFCVNQNIAPA